MDPDDIAGLILWLEADQITGLSNGDPIPLWEDQSGEGNDAVAVAAPIYQTNILDGKPVTHFVLPGPNAAGMTVPLTLANPFTVLYVGRYDESLGVRNARAIHGTNNWLLGPYGGVWQWFSGDFATAGPSAMDGAWIIHAVTQTGGSGTHYVYELETEDAPFSASRASPGAPGDLVLSPVTSEAYFGDFAEIVVYDSAISTDDLADLVLYFRQKWGGLGPAVPSAPTNLSATSAGGNNIDLTWDNVADETGYRIERSPNGTTGWASRGTNAADDVTFTDSGSCGTTYFYRVFAFNGDGDSPASNVDSASTDACPPPTPGGNRMGGTGAIRKPPRNR